MVNKNTPGVRILKELPEGFSPCCIYDNIYASKDGRVIVYRVKDTCQRVYVEYSSGDIIYAGNKSFHRNKCVYTAFNDISTRNNKRSSVRHLNGDRNDCRLENMVLENIGVINNRLQRSKQDDTDQKLGHPPIIFRDHKIYVKSLPSVDKAKDPIINKDIANEDWGRWNNGVNERSDMTPNIVNDFETWRIIAGRSLEHEECSLLSI